MRIVFTIIIFFFAGSVSFSQQANSRLKFEPGQTMNVTMQVKSFITQHTGGQAIDFSIDANAEHAFTVLNVAKDSTALHHQFNHIGFKFDGWGTKMNFDSDNESDLDGIFGKTIKEVLETSYDIAINEKGKVITTAPGTELSEADSRMAIIKNAMKDIFAEAQPPRKGETILFRKFQNKLIKGSSESSHTDTPFEKKDITYTVSDITDSTVVISFITHSVTIEKAEAMGSETITTMSNKSSGKIIFDKVTGLLKEKTETIESNGNTVSPVGKLPVSSSTTIIITVHAPQ